MKTHTDPKVDYAFKHVFGREQSKAALISLLDAVLQPPPGEGIANLELLNPFNDKEALDDKLSIVDIKARDQSGRHFNVEMQMLAYGAFPQRALYYWCRLHQGQLQEGDDYHLLRPTISVCFVDTPLFPEIDDHHLVFELRERRHPVVFTDQMRVHILELPKFTKTIDQLATPLDCWLFFLRHAERLDPDAVPEALNVPEVCWALGDLAMISQTDRERELYESRLKMRRDISYEMTEARTRGHAEGRAEGMEEGRAEGWRAHIRFLQKLLGRDVVASEQLQTLSAADLEALAARLEAEVAAKPENGS